MSKEKLKLYLDFDNTLVTTNKACIKILNERFNTNHSLPLLRRYDFKDFWPSVTDKDIDELFESDELFDGLEFIENCYETLYGIRNYIDPHIVSCGTRMNGHKKVEWLKEHSSEIFDKVTILTGPHGDKSSVNMEDGIFIDDHIECLRSSNAKIKILYKFYCEGDWNEFDNGDEIYVVNTWEEIKEILLFYIEHGGII